MKLDNKYKIGYAVILSVLVAYFGYSLYVGKLFYELRTDNQWDKANGHNSARVNRFYHK
jgi:hypothetical protein